MVRLSSPRPGPHRTPSDTSLLTLQVSSIEFSLVEKSILLGLQQGNAVLKEIHKEMTVEMVEKLMGETEDAVAYQRVSAINLFLRRLS